MKKGFIGMLCVLMLLCSLPVSAWMGEVRTQTETPTVKPGEEVTFTVSVFGLQLKSLALKLGEAFDSRVFTFVSGEWLVKTGIISDVDTQKLNAVIAFAKETQFDQQVVFTFTLRVREDAPAGETEVKVGAVMKAGNETDAHANAPLGCRVTVAGKTTTTTEPTTAAQTTKTTLPSSQSTVSSMGTVTTGSASVGDGPTAPSTTVTVTSGTEGGNGSSAPQPVTSDSTTTTTAASSGLTPGMTETPPTTSIKTERNSDGVLLGCVVAGAVLGVVTILLALYYRKRR